MRKLFLASFIYKFEGERTTGHTLVRYHTDPSDTFEFVQRTLCESVTKWFLNKFNPETCELIGVPVPFDTVPDHRFHQYKTDSEIVNLPPSGNAHPLDLHPEKHGDPEQNLSRKVVIDLNGKREHFVIGWYDFDSKRWMFDHDDLSMLEKKHAKWMDILPID